MALASAKLLRFVGQRRNPLSNAKCWLTPVVLGGQIQTANLTSVKHGFKAVPETVSPYPYEAFSYNVVGQFIDSTRRRFNENSRVVVVEGNVGVGKVEFAKKFAEEFGMKYVPNIGVDDVFIHPTGFDLRQVNERLPDHLKHVDLKQFYSEPDKKKNIGIGRTQLMLLTKRYFNYIDALNHFMNTGQGLVLSSGVFSDIVYAKTLYDMGYMSRAAFNYYKKFSESCLVDLWRPHLVIYMEASVPYLREQIIKRNDPVEVNSPVLTDEYLETLEKNYKEVFLESLDGISEIMMLEAEGEIDWDFLVEDCEKLPLLFGMDDRPNMFIDWDQDYEEDWNRYRMMVGRKDLMENNLVQKVPWNAMELTVYGDDADLYNSVIENLHEAHYVKRFNPEKKRILFKM